MLTAFLCAALSYPKKFWEGLPWVNDHPTSEAGNWFHHGVNDWVENVRGPVDADGINRSINTRVWSCFLAFVALVQAAVIVALAIALCVQLIVH